MNNNFLKDIDNTWTLFLDRDGVINKRDFGGYIRFTSEFEFIPSVLDSLAYFSTIFNKIIVITNQQGVGKGIMTEHELADLHNFMINKINMENGRIDAIYFCTELADTPNSCRKPSPKMAYDALSDFPEISIKKSIMVGDSHSDMEFGKNAGMFTVFVTGDSKENAPLLANYKVESLYDLKISIEKQLQL